MNPTDLISPQLKQIETSFLDWLRILGYSPATIETRRRNIKEFLLYLERCNVHTIEAITVCKARRYVRYLRRRENKLHGSSLMNASVNVGVSTVNKFFDYLQQTGKPTPENLQYLQQDHKSKTILTQKEIARLYEATYQKHYFSRKETRARQKAISQRDRAMLGIYYGCGLRKSEGVNLKAGDIQIERKLVYVRKGKGSKERYVPLTGNNLAFITEYLDGGRRILLERSEEQANSFFISSYGSACSDQSLSARLDRLVKNSGSNSLQEKKPTLHTLRHSIATHLLQQGMEIEMIQKFLGHSSLASTQVYTHIVNEL